MEHFKNICCFPYTLAILLTLLLSAKPDILARAHLYDADINECKMEPETAKVQLCNISCANICKFNNAFKKIDRPNFFSFLDQRSLEIDISWEIIYIKEISSLSQDFVALYYHNLRGAESVFYSWPPRLVTYDGHDYDYEEDYGHYAILNLDSAPGLYSITNNSRWQVYSNPHSSLFLLAQILQPEFHYYIEFNNTEYTSSFNCDPVDCWPESALEAHVGLHPNTIIDTVWIVSGNPKVLKFTSTAINMKKIGDSAARYKMEELAWISFFYLLMKTTDHSRCRLNMSSRFVHHDECWGFASSLSKSIF